MTGICQWWTDRGYVVFACSRSIRLVSLAGEDEDVVRRFRYCPFCGKRLKRPEGATEQTHE